MLSEQTEDLGSEAADVCQTGTDPQPAWCSLIHHFSPEGEKWSSTGEAKGKKGSGIQLVVLASHDFHSKRMLH